MKYDDPGTSFVELKILRLFWLHPIRAEYWGCHPFMSHQSRFHCSGKITCNYRETKDINNQSRENFLSVVLPEFAKVHWQNVYIAHFKAVHLYTSWLCNAGDQLFLPKRAQWYEDSAGCQRVLRDIFCCDVLCTKFPETDFSFESVTKSRVF